MKKSFPSVRQITTYEDRERAPLGDHEADDSEGAHGDVGHGAHEDIHQDREEGCVDAHHRVHSSQDGVCHTLQRTHRTRITILYVGHVL
jgi:hypothetical protein